MSNMQTNYQAILIAAALITSAACDGGSEAGTDAETETGGAIECGDGQLACDDVCIDAIDPTLTEIQAQIFAGCAFQGCHGEQGFREMLQLTSVDVSHENLVGVPSIQRPDWMLVEPGAPASSYLLNKLRGEDMSPASDGNPSQAMPVGAPLCEARIVVIEQWIADGAPKE